MENGIGRKWLKRGIWLLLTLAWMGLIFLFSAQPADVSTDLSEGLGYKLVSAFDEIQTLCTGEEMGQETRLLYTQAIDFPVRKAAHMTEYGILSLLVLGFLHSLMDRGNLDDMDSVKADILGRIHKRHLKRRFPLSLLVVFIYACSDEFHQLYVEGRAGLFTDVLIDCLGAVIFLGVALCVARHKERKENRVIF